MAFIDANGPSGEVRWTAHAYSKAAYLVLDVDLAAVFCSLAAVFAAAF